MDSNRAETNTPEKIAIKQIAIDPGQTGFRGEVYGVGVDGVVYLYNRDHQMWRPLSSDIFNNTIIRQRREEGEAEDV